MISQNIFYMYLSVLEIIFEITNTFKNSYWAIFLKCYGWTRSWISGSLYLECACFVLWYQLRVTFSWSVSLSLKETVAHLCFFFFFLPSKHPVVLTTMLTPVFSALEPKPDLGRYCFMHGSLVTVSSPLNTVSAQWLGMPSRVPEGWLTLWSLPLLQGHFDVKQHCSGLEREKTSIRVFLFLSP